MQKGGHPQLVLVHYSSGQHTRASSPFSFSVCQILSCVFASDHPVAQPAAAQLPAASRERACNICHGRAAGSEGLPWGGRSRAYTDDTCGRTSWYELPRYARDGDTA